MVANEPVPGALDMKILVIDTSTASGAVALVEAGKVIAQRQEKYVKAHAKWLMGAIDSLFKDAKAIISDIDLIAVTTGPGSFTGLRIGVTTVKGLSWASGRPIKGVSTLRALAMNVKGPALICPVLDARKKELYAALYRADGSGSNLEEVMSDRAISPALLCEEISRRSSGEAIVFLGSGLLQYRESIVSGVSLASFAPEDDWLIRAVNIAIIAAGDTSEPIPAQSLVPLYRRRSEAEINAR